MRVVAVADERAEEKVELLVEKLLRCLAFMNIVRGVKLPKHDLFEPLARHHPRDAVSSLRVDRVEGKGDKVERVDQKVEPSSEQAEQLVRGGRADEALHREVEAERAVHLDKARVGIRHSRHRPSAPA